MTTHYDVLELNQSTADTLSIKKAYRRLALLHHPDRNNGSAESTEKFKQISEAYEVLSDPTSKKEYDYQLKYGGGSSGYATTSSSTNPTAANAYYYHRQQRRHYRDPFAQFNDLFRNDPFFQEGFRDIDDLFAQKFQQQQQKQNNNSNNQQQRSNSSSGSDNTCNDGWLAWILKRCGVEFQMTTKTTDQYGNVSASYYRSSQNDGTTKKNQRNYIDSNGQQVTIRSMIKNGNQIEDKHINGELVERKINGCIEPIQTIQNQN